MPLSRFRAAIMTAHAAARAAVLRIAILVGVGLLALSVPASAGVHSQWVELGPDGTATVRAIADAACPQVSFDGAVTPMGVRAEPSLTIGNVKPAVFAVRSCEVSVPPGAVAAILDGKPLPLPRGTPQRIMIFGDTGCRLDARSSQACNDPVAWPFAKIAAAAAATRPDLVIHVGDYHYRETPCQTERSDCARSPWGFGFDAWDADFFTPAAPLLAAAPWIMVRGNHEDCARAGEGWMRFLDPLPIAAACRDFSGVYLAQLGDFGVVVVDGARADDPKRRDDLEALAGRLRGQFEGIAARVPAEAWMVAHRPFNAMRSADGRTENEVDNAVQELAFGAVMPAGVRMSVAGHIHFFQAVDFGAARPAQLVVGTGGDNLVPVPPLSMAGADINGRKVVSAVTISGFAYMVWDRAGPLWIGTLFDTGGKPISHCRLFDRSLGCGP